MKLHSSAIKEMVKIFETHGGHRGNEWVFKLLAELDLSTYHQTSTGREVLVLTKELRERSGN